MNFSEAEKYLYSFTDYEKIPGIAYTAANYDLKRMELLLEPMGNPHLQGVTIHIAGTKGKGSTAAMIAGILAVAGFKTGLYTSPHLFTVRERICINGKMISEGDFASLITDIKPIVEEINRKSEYGQLTTFEILTAVALRYFQLNSVDFKVLEAGLGGRLDATNVTRGDICVITSISLDHTDILGNTAGKIATEKAGIIKPGSLVVNFPQTNEVTGVIREVAIKNKAQLTQIGKDVTWKRTGGSIDSQNLKIKGKMGEYKINLPLIGDFQLQNAAGAVAAIEFLIAQGYKITGQNIIDGIAGVKWPGRLQVIGSAPYLLVDGAHNAYSMTKLVESVKKYFKFHGCIVVFGSSSDKDINGMAKELVKLTSNIIATSSVHPRAASITVIRKAFEKLDIPVKETRGMPEAITLALNEANKNDLVLVTGSLFVVGEAIRYMDQHHHQQH